MKLIGDTHVSLFHKGRLYKFESNDSRYRKAAKLLNEDKLDEFVKLHGTNEVVAAVKKVDKEIDFYVEGNRVFFGEFEITGALAQKIERILDEGLDPKPFANFVKKLLKNPSANSVHQLYTFLGYKELAITPEGNFIGYKGVNDNYYSISGNLKTVVLKGTVDKTGRILNEVGEEIEVQRNNVDDDPNRHCSTGLHVGSMDYAVGFGSRTVMVEVDPADVVSVPRDCNFQKLRVCRYKVVAEFEKEVTAAVAEVKDKKIVEHKGTTTKAKKKDSKPTASERSKVGEILGRWSADEWEAVKVSSVSNAVSPDYIKQSTVALIAKELGYKVEDGWIYL